MSRQASLAITLAKQEESESISGLLTLEQEEWKAYTGLLTKANMVRHIAFKLFGGKWNPQIDCAISGERVTSTIYAYPATPTLPYRVLASYGELSEGRVQTPVLTETVHFRLETEQGLRYPAHSLVSANWLTAYDAEGNQIPAPGITIKARSVGTAFPVYGSLQIKYRTFRTAHTLSMEARDDALEHFWSAYILGLPLGGEPVLLKFDPPPTAEELTAMAAECGGRIGLSLEWEEQDPANRVTPGKKEEVWDYCGGNFLREN